MSEPLSSASKEQPDITALGIEAHQAALSALSLDLEAADAAAKKAEVSALHLSTTTKSLLDGMGVSLALVDQGGYL